MSDTVDMEKVEALAGKVVGDVAGAMGLLLAYLGDQAGVYEALETHGPCKAADLAEALGMNEKYVHEWLASNAPNGYITHDPTTERFSLTPEQALVFAREGHPPACRGSSSPSSASSKNTTRRSRARVGPIWSRFGLASRSPSFSWVVHDGQAHP